MRRLLIFLVLGAILGVSGFAQGEVVVDCEGGEEDRLIDGDSECGGPFEGDPKEELGDEIGGEKSEVELDADPHSSDNDAASPEEEVEVELSPYIYPELNGLDAEDPVLIEALREKVLIFPPKKKRPIKHRRPPTGHLLKGQFGQPMEVDELYGGRRNGFFIEAGAFNGEEISNSLFFEIKRNWTGLLVEPNPEMISLILELDRHAVVLPNCLGISRRVEETEFDGAEAFGGIINKGQTLPGDLGLRPDQMGMPRHFRRFRLRVQCFPLQSVLLALGNPPVDYFSLDIEGAEFPVLNTIPFDKVDIRLLGIEQNHLGDVFKGDLEDVKGYLDTQGYDYLGNVKIDGFYAKRDARELMDSDVAENFGKRRWSKIGVKKGKKVESGEKKTKKKRKRKKKKGDNK